MDIDRASTRTTPIMTRFVKICFQYARFGSHLLVIIVIGGALLFELGGWSIRLFVDMFRATVVLYVFERNPTTLGGSVNSGTYVNMFKIKFAFTS